MPRRLAPLVVGGLLGLAGPSAAVVPVGATAPPDSAPAACEPMTAAEPASPDADGPPRPGPFGPLGLEAAVRVVATETVIAADRVPGGVLIASGPDRLASTITFVDDGGVVRWRACFERPVRAFTAPAAPTDAIVAVLDSGDTVPAPSTIDLATGTIAPWDALPDDRSWFVWESDPAQGLVLFGPAVEASGLAAGTELMLVDLADDAA